MCATMPSLISVLKILHMPVHTCTLAHMYVATHVWGSMCTSGHMRVEARS